MSKKPKDDHCTFTYQTRLSQLSAADEVALSAYAELHGMVERKLFAEGEKAKAKQQEKSFRSMPNVDSSALLAHEKDIKDSNNATKREFLTNFGLTGRQYNAILFGLRGKVDSIKALRPEGIKLFEAKIKQAQKSLAKLEKLRDELLNPTSKARAKTKKEVKPLTPAQRQQAIDRFNFKIHHKKRRLVSLQNRLKSKVLGDKNDAVHLCFGSKKLFRKQFALVENGYINTDDWAKAKDDTQQRKVLKEQGLAAWRLDWQAARASQFFVMGSGDETAGCQGCVAVLGDDGKLTLKLRLPNNLKSDHGTYINLPNVSFAYGQKEINQALASGEKITTQTASGKEVVRRVGTALSYRFLKDAKGWRVFVSVGLSPKPQVTSKLDGAIGIDINADHIALTEIDRFGNWLASVRYDAHTYGTSTDQAEAILGDIAKAIAEKALASGKPVVVEKLDFAKKKAELERDNPRYARMLSSFTYSKTLTLIAGACFKRGVEVIDINPAFTSTIGAVNFAQRLGISVHQAAAMAIARRGLGFSEKPIGNTESKPQAKQPAKQPTNSKPASTDAVNPLKPKRVTVNTPLNSGRKAYVPNSNGSHTTLALPVRNRARHGWLQWSAIRKALKTAHVALARSGSSLGNPVPLRRLFHVSGTNWVTLPKKQRVNRRKHCLSGVVVDDFPHWMV